MSTCLIDETGNRYGRLTVLGRDNTKSKHDAHWICKCDCGNIFTTKGTRLRNGRCKSCGCLQKELLSKRQTTHNQTNTRLYRIWNNLKDRCFNKNCKDFCNYGERGISVCENWIHSFESFRDWAINNGYNDILQIDRIDNDKGYNPENCRWTTIKQQARNRRTNRTYEYNGKQLCLIELAEICGLSKDALRYRLNAGYSLKDAMFTKLNQNKGRKLYGTK